MECCPPNFDRLGANIVLLTGRIDDLVAITPRKDPLPLADALDYIYRDGPSFFYAYSPRKGLRILRQSGDAGQIKNGLEEVDQGTEEDGFDIGQIINATMDKKKQEFHDSGKRSAAATGRFVNEPDGAIIELHKVFQSREKVLVYFEYIPLMCFHSNDNEGHIQALLNELPEICEKNKHLILFAGKLPNQVLESVYPSPTQKILRLPVGGPSKAEIRTVLIREEFKHKRQIVIGNIFDKVVDVMFLKGKSPENGLKTLRDNWICDPNASFDEDWIKENGAPVMDFGKLDLDELRILFDENLIGQKLPKSTILDKLENLKVFGKDSEKGPLLRFLFAGPSGVGKTRMADILTEFLFGAKNEMLNVDCSRLSAKQEVATLLGAPPGYVGHESPGKLEAHLSKYPCGLILLDEFEKAHDDIKQSFLGLLEEGFITSNRTNERLDFFQYIIIATTNAGKREVDEAEFPITDCEGREEAYKSALKSHFSTELLGRFDRLLVFEFLSESQMIDVAKLYVVNTLKKLGQKYFEERNVYPPEVKATSEYYKAVISDTDRELGARNIKKIVEDSVKEFWKENLLSGNETIAENFKLTSKYVKNS